MFNFTKYVFTLFRLIGLEPLVTSSCINDIRIMIYNTNYRLDSYLNPIMILIAYYSLALTSKLLIKKQKVSKGLSINYKANLT